MDTRKLSAAILIPCYNAEPHLRQCLESATAQGFPVLLCDDSSTDRSLEIAQKYPIQIIKNRINLGVGKTRQLLVNIARKNLSPDFIQFLDADDYLLINSKISNQLVSRNDADILMDDLLFIYPNGTQREIAMNPDLLKAARNKQIWQLNACLLKTNKIPDFRPINACSDALFLIDCIKAGLTAKRTSKIPTSAYRRNWGPDQVTAKYHRERETLSAIFEQELVALAKLF